jgi:hypothetical protein
VRFRQLAVVTKKGRRRGRAKSNAPSQIAGADHRALAFTGHYYYHGQPNVTERAEAIRLVLERCGYQNQVACLLVSVDGMATVRVPKTRRIAGPFMLTTATEISDVDKQRIGEIYEQKEWRALARGTRGTWHAVANAPSEEAAVDGAMASCAQGDIECRIHAIGNFRVADEN